MRIILLILSTWMFTACNNQAEETVPQTDSIDIEDAYLAPEERPTWISLYDTVTNEFYLKKQRDVDTDTLTPATVIADNNGIWANIQLLFEKVSHDTIFVAIPESEYLTDRMGSSGSAEFMASTTYNLTELKGIRYVHYRFKSGEHLSPGTVTRQSFKDYK